VKRILGTAEDYRRLYGGGLLDPNQSLHVSGAAMAPVRSRSVRSSSTSRQGSGAAAKAKPKGKSKVKAAVPAKKTPAARKPARTKRARGA
jgi:hypothetical protein